MAKFKADRAARAAHAASEPEDDGGVEGEWLHSRAGVLPEMGACLRVTQEILRDTQSNWSCCPGHVHALGRKRGNDRSTDL